MTSCPNETWKSVPNYEGLYMVSDKGRVKSLSFGGRILKPWLHNAGYICVTLSDAGVRVKHLVHRLVASAFIPNPKSLPYINHINGDKTDNRVENLEWCSGAYNAWHNAHVLRHESTITKRAVICLDDGRRFDSAAEAARAVHGQDQNIVKCCQGKRNTHKGLAWAYAEVEA
jgi:hypothetical protein